MNALITFLWTRLAHAVSHFFHRAAAGTPDGLEEYLSTAKSLHQLEDMQRNWDLHHGAF
jgi:hypothetical protein